MTTTAYGYTRNLPSDDPQAIIERTVEVAAPRPHDLLVHIHAVSVNPVDVKLRASAPAEDGFRILGFDASGTVVGTGDAVTLFKAGDEVYYAGDFTRPGTNQGLHLVDERLVGAKPEDLSHADAASLPLTALTAWECIFDRLEITKASTGTLLVVGASGGVGSVMIQLVRELAPEVRIIATASNQESVKWVTDLGAHRTVNHHEDLVEQVHQVVGDGVDWLFTGHSEGQIETYAEIVKPFGAIVAIDDGPRDVAPLKDKCISWHWEFMFSTALYAPESTHQHDILDRVAALVDHQQLRATTTKVLSPINADTLREAHRLVEDGHVIGKIVISDEPA
jgi:NADPH2:quinone reductase